MARGRLISRTLGSSRKFAALVRHGGRLGEFCQALYPLLVAHADDFGRLAGDAFTVKHAVFPTSLRKEPDFTEALRIMQTVGLISWYSVENQEIIQVVDFETHQTGLHNRTKSRFPQFQESSGNSRILGIVPSKGTELNLTELIRSPDKPATREVDPDLDLGVTNGEVGAFLRRFCELWSRYTHGATYNVKRTRDVPHVRHLLQLYGRTRLEKLAVVLLTAEDDWIADTDRGIGILSVKASKLDALLAEYEAKHGAIA